MKYQVCIFDWDGTLVNSEQHIVSSIQQAAKLADLPELEYDQIKNIIGLGMREALLALYPELTHSKITELREHYSSFFFAQSAMPFSLFEGVTESLELLKSRGKNLAVATGKSRRGLELALDSSQLRRFFDIERCADETQSKPNTMMLEQIVEFYSQSRGIIGLENFLLVGDTEYDLEMAANMGIDSVGVSYGVHDVERLLKHKPIKIIDNFSEILML